MRVCTIKVSIPTQREPTKRKKKKKNLSKYHQPKKIKRKLNLDNQLKNQTKNSKQQSKTTGFQICL